MRWPAATIAGGMLIISGVAGCTSPAASARVGTCLAPLSAGVVASSSARPAADDSARPSAVGGRKLPSIALGCLDGSGDVKLTSVGRPMIVSFWQSACAPCRVELPHLETFANAAGGAVAVVGVDTADERSKGRSMASDFGLTFPMVSDPDTTMLKSVAPPELPTLLFVTADGRIADTLASNQVDVATLRQLTAKYLGVTVA
jgi:thiol-disulfide isomerase/thioredoxin